MEKERLHYLDITKSLVIIGTILIHISYYYEAFCGGYNKVFLYMEYVVGALVIFYYMPIYFIMRGYYYRSCSLSEEIINGCKRLIVPMFLLFYWGEQWFCYAMFFALVEYNVIRRIRSKYLQLIIMLLLACLGNYMRRYDCDWRYLSFAFMLAPFFWIGERKKWIVDSERFGVFSIVVYVLGGILFLLYVPEEKWANCQLSGASYPTLKQLMFVYPAAVFGSSIVFWISRRIKRNRYLEYIGRNSMVFFLFHINVLLWLYPVVSIYLDHLQDTGSYVVSAAAYVLIFMLCIAICYCVSKFVNRYCPWVIGKGL